MRLMTLTGATRLSGKRRADYLAGVLTVGLGVIVSLIVFRMVWKLEERTAAAAFERDAKNIVASLRRSVEASLHEMESIAAFYAASREVNRHEFREFVKPFLARTSDIQALSWTPRVPGARRATYEQAARRNGFPDFQITEVNVEGQLVKAAPRAEYFPVYFIEPHKGNEPALGFDLASEPTRLKTLNVLRDTGKAVATPPVRLVQEPGSQKGFLILSAVYRGDSPTDSVGWRRAHLAGLLSGVFRIGTLIEGALKHLEPRGFDVYVFDESAPQGQQLLYFQSSQAGRGRADFPRDQTAATLRTGLYHAAALDIAGWKWSIVSKPGPDYIGANTVWGPWALLLGGLACTAFLAMYITERKRTEGRLLTLKEELEQRVRERTATLEATNTQLENEVAERKRVEAETRELLEETARARAALSSILEDQQQAQAALRESEEKFRILAEASVVAIFVFQGEQLRYANPAATTISGYANAELLNMRFWDLIHPDFRELVRQRGLARQRGETVQTRYEVKILTKEGDERWVDFGGGFIMFEGTPATLGVAFDITERRRAEAALQESEERFRQLSEATFEGIGIHDRGTLLDVNVSFCRMFGYERSELIGMSVLELAAPESRELVLERMRTGYEKVYEAIGLRKDGTRFMGELVGRPIQYQGRAARVAALRDITERKRAEAALQQSELKYRRLHETMTDAFVLGNMAGNLLESNRTFQEMLGYTEAELRQLTYMDITPEKWHAFEARIVQEQILPKGFSGVYEKEYRRKDGTVFPVELRVSLVRDDAGQPVAMSAIVRDITERKQAEKALLEAEARLRLSVTASNIGLWDWNLVTNDVYFSREWKGQLGYTEDEMPNRFEEWESRVHPDDLAPTLAKVRAFIEDPDAEYAVEFRLRHKDGSYRWIFTRAQVFRDAAGKPLRMLGCHIDITERKQAEEALREKEHLLSESQRIAHIGSWLYDMTGRLSWSDETYRVYGVSPDTFTPNIESFLNLIHPEDRPAMQGWIAACLADEKPGDLEFRSIMPDGTVRFISGRGELKYDAENRPTYMAGTAQDITDRKQAEQEQKRLFEAVEASRERLQVLSTSLVEAQETERRYIAGELHDEIGQALTALKMNLQAMKRLSDDGRLAKLLKGSVEVIDRALQQTRALSLDLRPRMLDDLGLLPALRWLVDQRCRQAGLETQIVADLPEGRLPSLVETACFRVAQEALTNVLRHARARSVRVEVRQRGVALEISIHDDGIGFDVKAAQKGATHGASFGLLGMEERAHLVGGQIEIVSAPTRGTTIRASFPLAAIPPSANAGE